MNALEELSPAFFRAIVYAVVFYFALLGYWWYTGDATAYLLAQVLFGIVAIGFGIVLYRDSGGEMGAITAGAGAFIIGGLAQLGWLATDNQALDELASIAVLAGALIYLYMVLSD